MRSLISSSVLLLAALLLQQVLASPLDPATAGTAAATTPDGDHLLEQEVRDRLQALTSELKALVAIIETRPAYDHGLDRESKLLARATLRLQDATDEYELTDEEVDESANEIDVDEDGDILIEVDVEQPLPDQEQNEEYEREDQAGNELQYGPQHEDKSDATWWQALVPDQDDAVAAADDAAATSAPTAASKSGNNKNKKNKNKNKGGRKHGNGKRKNKNHRRKNKNNKRKNKNGKRKNRHGKGKKGGNKRKQVNKNAATSATTEKSEKKATIKKKVDASIPAAQLDKLCKLRREAAVAGNRLLGEQEGKEKRPSIALTLKQLTTAFERLHNTLTKQVNSTTAAAGGAGPAPTASGSGIRQVSHMLGLGSSGNLQPPTASPSAATGSNGRSQPSNPLDPLVKAALNVQGSAAEALKRILPAAGEGESGSAAAGTASAAAASKSSF